MTKRKLKDKLDELNNLQLSGQERIDYLAKILADKNNFLVAAAAKLIAKENIKELTQELKTSFERFLQKPIKTDPSCAAKQAILEALINLDSRETELYLKAVRYTQLEPVWGGHEDTAVKLRTLGAYGLVKSNYTGLMNELAGLLADKEISARVAAISALRNTNAMIAVPLLRHKALIGDPSVRVMSACFDALLALEANESRDFVATFLTSEELVIAQSAALALGEARIEGSLALLTQAYENTVLSELQQTLCTAMATLRNDEAIAYLFEIVKKDDFNSAGAINALKMLDDAEILQRLEQIQIE